MKRSLEKAGQNLHVKWDEENLRENEEIKANLHFTKIDEPKTPYLRGIEPDGDEDFAADAEGMSPLNLEEDEEVLADGEVLPESHGDDETEELVSNGNANGYTVTPQTSDDDLKRLDHKRSILADSSQPATHQDLHVQFRCETVAEPEQDGSDDDDNREEKRRCFEEHRKEHYNMKEALKRGKELIDGEDE